MDQLDNLDVEQQSAQLEDSSTIRVQDEHARQLALSKISRRYAAYVVPLALAVMSNKASAAS